jgi:hypothetical protein
MVPDVARMEAGMNTMTSASFLSCLQQVLIRWLSGYSFCPGGILILELHVRLVSAYSLRESLAFGGMLNELEKFMYCYTQTQFITDH